MSRSNRQRGRAAVSMACQTKVCSLRVVHSLIQDCLAAGGHQGRTVPGHGTRHGPMGITWAWRKWFLAATQLRCTNDLHAPKASVLVSLTTLHSRARDNKPLYLDHPQFEGFEVRQTVGRGKVA
jgi:hypothetical protein